MAQSVQRIAHCHKPLAVSQRQSAFTLIELLVAVAIIALLTMISIPAFSGFARRQTLYQATKDLKTDLRSAQNKAVSGVDGLLWGVHFDVAVPQNQNYKIFVTQKTAPFNYSLGTVKTTKTLPSGVTISAVSPNSGGSANVIFNRQTGEAGFYDNNGNPLTGSTLTVTLLLSGTPPGSVIVERGGKIYEQ